MLFEVGKLYRTKRITKFPLFFKVLGKEVWLDLAEKNILLCVDLKITNWENREMAIFLFDNKQGTLGDIELISSQMEEVYYDIRGGQVIYTNR